MSEAKEWALLARKLIASLDTEADPNAEGQWMEVIDRRSREMKQGRVDARPEEEVLSLNISWQIARRSMADR